ASIGGKWIEILREITPGLGRSAIMFNPETAPYVNRYYRGPFEAAARSYGVQPSANPVHNEREIASAVAALQGAPPGGLIVMPDTFNIVHRGKIIELAAQQKIPAIYPYTFAVREGGLIGYGVDTVDLFRRAAAYVDRILKGAKPAELPMQAPVKFELAINLKTANALGLTIPQMLLATADQVFEWCAARAAIAFTPPPAPGDSGWPASAGRGARARCDPRTPCGTNLAAAAPGPPCCRNRRARPGYRAASRRSRRRHG